MSGESDPGELASDDSNSTSRLVPATPESSVAATRMATVGAILITVLGAGATLSFCATPTPEVVQQNSCNKLDPGLAKEYPWLQNIKVDAFAVMWWQQVTRTQISRGSS